MIKGRSFNVGWYILSIALAGCGAGAAEGPANGSEPVEIDQVASAIVTAGEAFARVSAVGVLYPGAYNSVGATPTVTKNGTGKYLVRFPDMGGTYNPHVVAVSGTSDRCAIESVALEIIGNAALVNVVCTSRLGTLKDVEFAVRLERSNATSDPASGGYLMTNATSAAVNGSISTFLSYNSTSQTNAVTYLGTGKYRVKFPGISDLKPNVQVTAVGSTTGQYCKINSWAVTGLPEAQVLVDCYNVNGNAANTKFSVSFRGINSGQGWGLVSGSSVLKQVPRACFGNPGTITVAYPSSTAPAVTMPFLGSPDEGVAIVTASANNNSNFCNLLSWQAGPNNGVIVNARCYTAAGSLVQTPFQIMYRSSTIVPC